MEHVTSLPNSTHWRSLARRSTADSTHVLPGSNRSIDARSIVTLIFFFLISTSTFLSLARGILIIDILVIWPIHIPLPLFLTHLRNRFLPTTPSVDAEKPEEKEKGQGMYFKLGLETAPVIGVLVLLASTCIPGSVVRDGIVGSEGVRHYDIMTLFISFVSPPFIHSLFALAHFVAMPVQQLATKSSSLEPIYYRAQLISGLHINLTRLYRCTSIPSPFSRYKIRFIRFIPLPRILPLLLPNRPNNR
jgi:hypothetical protein